VTIAISAGASAVSRAALAELDEVAAECGATSILASAAAARGALALAEQRVYDAIAPLREAWRQWCELGARFEAAQVRVLLAEAYAQTGDPAAARMELEGARATFAELGAPVEENRVQRLLAELAPGVRETNTFVFTDIVDSTRLVELVGDEGWDSLSSWHDRTVRECIASHRGREIKHEGDGFFIAFPHPRSAVDFAIALQRRLLEHRRDHGFAPSVRIGIHAAEATRRGGDFFGQGVHVAARVAGASDAGEILATAATMASLGDGDLVSEPRPLALKGVLEPVEVVQLRWR
jgi:class 3 adenylate cyclase